MKKILIYLLISLFCISFMSAEYSVMSENEAQSIYQNRERVEFNCNELTYKHYSMPSCGVSENDDLLDNYIVDNNQNILVHKVNTYTRKALLFQNDIIKLIGFDGKNYNMTVNSVGFDDNNFGYLSVKLTDSNGRIVEGYSDFTLREEDNFRPDLFKNMVVHIFRINHPSGSQNSVAQMDLVYPFRNSNYNVAKALIIKLQDSSDINALSLNYRLKGQMFLDYSGNGDVIVIKDSDLGLVRDLINFSIISTSSIEYVDIAYDNVKQSYIDLRNNINYRDYELDRKVRQLQKISDILNKNNVSNNLNNTVTQRPVAQETITTTRTAESNITTPVAQSEPQVSTVRRILQKIPIVSIIAN